MLSWAGAHILGLFLGNLGFFFSGPWLLVSVASFLAGFTVERLRVSEESKIGRWFKQ